ncbi:unnamed protein product [Pseudo-nitzschia multistriata]|uniref:Uncharacterized protein n=1 Tax=Pseudo-nitzschia multistriata TaxID=183589 RepID=A0A448ZAS2_9STRA|nr:unnamed protein product [Pseudo-nitzschia multistriata]
MLPILYKNRSLDSRRSQRLMSAIAILPSSIFLLLCFISTEISGVSIALVSGWSQTNFIQSFGGRRTPVSFSPGSSQWAFRVRLGKAPANCQSDFFEDPSIGMDNSNREAKELYAENMGLRDSIQKLEEENERLKKFVEQQHQRGAGTVSAKKNNNDKTIVLERFEGEHLFDFDTEPSTSSLSSQAVATNEMKEELWCDVLDGDQCPVEPSVSFGEALRDRAYWLVGLLIMQSLSGIILSRNELLLANHPVIIYYLTMMVGAGGNAGNQASVRGMFAVSTGRGASGIISTYLFH